MAEREVGGVCYKNTRTLEIPDISILIFGDYLKFRIRPRTNYIEVIKGKEAGAVLFYIDWGKLTRNTAFLDRRVFIQIWCTKIHTV